MSTTGFKHCTTLVIASSPVLSKYYICTTNKVYWICRPATCFVTYWHFQNYVFKLCSYSYPKFPHILSVQKSDTSLMQVCVVLSMEFCHYSAHVLQCIVIWVVSAYVTVTEFIWLSLLRDARGSDELWTASTCVLKYNEPVNVVLGVLFEYFN